MTQVWNKIKGIWDNVVTSVKTAGTNLWTEVEAMWNKVKEFFEGIDLFETGKKIIQGLIDGIGSMGTALAEKIESIAVNFGKKVKGLFSFKTSTSLSVETGEQTPQTNGSFAKGLAYVPWDGFIAELHKGERVLTAEENKQYEQSRYTPQSSPARSPGGQNVSFNAPAINITVNGSADEKTVMNIQAAVRQEMQDMLEAAARIMGVDIVGVN